MMPLIYILCIIAFLKKRTWEYSNTNRYVFLLFDRIKRIYMIFSQLPDEAEKDQSAAGGNNTAALLKYLSLVNLRAPIPQSKQGLLSKWDRAFCLSVGKAKIS